MIEQVQKQEQRLSQKQLLNLKILQMNCLDLEAYIQEEALCNPVMDVAEEESLPLPVAEEDLYDDWEDTHISIREDVSDLSPVIPVNPFADTLERHLLDQLILLDLPLDQLPLLRFIIFNLDANGYFRETPETLAGLCSVPKSFAAEAIKTVQALDPPGVAAASLEECLTLQLERAGAPLYCIRIVKGFLPEIAKRQYQLIADALGLSLSEVKTAADTISSLDPKPGSRFETAEPLHYIVPDVSCVLENRQIQISTRFQKKAPFSLNSYYQEMLSSSDDSEVIKYLSERIRAAEELLLSVENRESTLLKCAKLLVEKQADHLFSSGSKKPFTMTEAAELLHLHVSTVSRTVQGKYIQSPKGVFPLASLFCQPVSNTFAVTPDQVKERIRYHIDHERKEKPLSDQQITDRLKEEGCSLSRRVVAKYRTEMGILTASERKNIP